MWTIGNVSTQEKGKDIFWLERAGSFKGHVRRTYSVCRFLDKRSIRADCWILKLFTRQILEKPTDRPTKVCEKLSDFWKSLHVQSRVVIQWDFWEGGFWVSLWSNVMHFSQKPCERSGIIIGTVSTEEKARICSGLGGLSASAEKDMFGVLTAYVRSLRNTRYVNETCFTRQILEITTDWPMQESLRKNCPILGKLTCLKARWRLWESGFGLLSILEHRDFDDPGTADLINEFRGRVGPEACRRTAPGYAHGQVRTHGQTLLFYRYRYADMRESGEPYLHITGTVQHWYDHNDKGEDSWPLLSNKEQQRTLHLTVVVKAREIAFRTRALSTASLSENECSPHEGDCAAGSNNAQTLSEHHWTHLKLLKRNKNRRTTK